MIEPEMAFADLFDAMSNAERFVKNVIKYAVSECAEDIDFFEKFFDNILKAKLDKLVNQPFVRIPYKDAIKLLQVDLIYSNL
jgi:asparaginyl-tRNA synthetase